MPWPKGTPKVKTGGRKPGARNKVSPDVKAVRELTANEYTRIAVKYLSMTHEEIAAEIKRPELGMLELLVGGIVMKAVQKQDDRLATFLLDRVIGKVPTVVDGRMEITDLHMANVEAIRERNERLGLT